MADEGMVVLDGTELRDLDLRLPVPDGPVAGAMALQLAESEASTRLFGISLPENIRSTALRTIREADDLDFLSEVFHDSDALRSLIQKFLLVVADQLKGLVKLDTWMRILFVDSLSFFDLSYVFYVNLGK